MSTTNTLFISFLPCTVANYKTEGILLQLDVLLTEEKTSHAAQRKHRPEIIIYCCFSKAAFLSFRIFGPLNSLRNVNIPYDSFIFLSLCVCVCVFRWIYFKFKVSYVNNQTRKERKGECTTRKAPPNTLSLLNTTNKQTTQYMWLRWSFYLLYCLGDISGDISGSDGLYSGALGEGLADERTTGLVSMFTGE